MYSLIRLNRPNKRNNKINREIIFCHIEVQNTKNNKSKNNKVIKLPYNLHNH